MNCPSPSELSDLRADIATQRHLARLRATPRARYQWGTASPGGLLAESHVNSSVDSLAPTQGAPVTGLRQRGAL